jgi:hypothetical protein
MAEEGQLATLNKDIDVLPGYERKQLKPAMVNILEQQVSVNEAFDAPPVKVDPFATGTEDPQASTSLAARWSKYKNFCLASFQTRASDFTKTDVSMLVSRRVRDRLAELAVSSDEAQLITSMQQNEEALREEIKSQSAELERLHRDSLHWEMIELISRSCELLVNAKSPQFYPAQFMMVLDLVDSFGRMVYDRINLHSITKGSFLKEAEATKQLLALNWSMILCRTSHLLPRLLLQISFLRCVRFHPFKSVEEAIHQIVNAIPGLGTASAGVYVRSYFVYTVFSQFPETSCDLLLPLFTSYGRALLHLKNGAFERQFKIMDYQFVKYVETHGPALRFFVSVMVQVGDAAFLRTALDEFYSLGVPSAFILECLLEELPPKFVARIYQVLLILIDKSDDVVPHPNLIHRLLTSLTNAALTEGILELMNDVWNRMREFKSVEDFVYVAAPMTAFIAKFCAPHYLNRFLDNVAQVLHHNFAGRKENAKGQMVGSRMELSKKLTDCVTQCIVYTVNSHRNFEQVLTHTGAIVDLMDFLNESALAEVSRIILNDVSVKPFDMNDPLCIRILLELSQILFQSLSVLSPVDVIEKTNRIIEWFLYRVDFGGNIEAHLSFLLSARQAFPTGVRPLSAIALIALRLTSQVATRKPASWDVIARSLLAFAFVTIPSVPDPQTRALLYLAGANAALVCTVICFAHAYYDEYFENLKAAPLNAGTFQLYLQGLNYLLIMPAKPKSGDPFAVYRDLVASGLKREWADDERIRLALEALVILSHAQRSEYVLRVQDVDSNDVLFAGNADFKAKGSHFMSVIMARFIQALQQLKSKGIGRTKLPALALKAIGTLPDVYGLDETLMAQLKVLANMTVGGEGRPFIEQKKGVVRHLARVFATNDTGKAFLKKFAQGL